MKEKRICFECDHSYEGDLKCPQCGVSAGEPLEVGKVDHNMDNLFMELAKCRVEGYLKIPSVKNAFDALSGLCFSSLDELAVEEQVAVTCSEAIRYAYRMGREVGIDKETFMNGLTIILDAEDTMYRTKYYN